MTSPNASNMSVIGFVCDVEHTSISVYSENARTSKCINGQTGRTAWLTMKGYTNDSYCGRGHNITCNVIDT